MLSNSPPPRGEEKASSSPRHRGQGLRWARDAGILGRWHLRRADGSAGRACPAQHGALSGNLNLNVKKLLFITGGISSPSPFVTWSGAVTLLISNK